MKSIMRSTAVLVMVFTLVSISGTGAFAGTTFSNNNTPAVSNDTHPMCWAGYCPDMKTYLEQERRDRDIPRPRLNAPEPMGSPGV